MKEKTKSFFDRFKCIGISLVTILKGKRFNLPVSLATYAHIYIRSSSFSIWSFEYCVHFGCFLMRNSSPSPLTIPVVRLWATSINHTHDECECECLFADETGWALFSYKYGANWFASTDKSNCLYCTVIYGDTKFSLRFSSAGFIRRLIHFQCINFTILYISMSHVAHNRIKLNIILRIIIKLALFPLKLHWNCTMLIHLLTSL